MVAELRTKSLLQHVQHHQGLQAPLVFQPRHIGSFPHLRDENFQQNAWVATRPKGLQRLNQQKKTSSQKTKKIGLSISLRLATIGRCFRILLRYTRHCARCHTRYRLWLFGWLFGDDTRGQGLETIPDVESHDAIPPQQKPMGGVPNGMLTYRFINFII